MKYLFLLLITCLPALTSTGQNNATIKDEVNVRESLIMNYLTSTIKIDAKTEKSVSHMVDIFMQTIIQLSANGTAPQQLRPVYSAVVKNHIDLLSDYLTEEQLSNYLEEVRPEKTDAELCPLCQSARKAAFKYCVFCAHSFE